MVTHGRWNSTKIPRLHSAESLLRWQWIFQINFGLKLKLGLKFGFELSSSRSVRISASFCFWIDAGFKPKFVLKL